MGEEVGEEVLLPDQVYREPSHGGTLPRMLARGGKRGEGSSRLPVPLGAASKSELGRVNRAESEGYSSESSSGDVGRGERVIMHMQCSIVCVKQCVVLALECCYAHKALPCGKAWQAPPGS